MSNIMSRIWIPPAPKAQGPGGSISRSDTYVPPWARGFTNPTEGVRITRNEPQQGSPVAGAVPGGGGGQGRSSGGGPWWKMEPDDGKRIGNSRAKNAAIRAREAAYSPLDAFYEMNPNEKALAEPGAASKQPIARESPASDGGYNVSPELQAIFDEAGAANPWGSGTKNDDALVASMLPRRAEGGPVKAGQPYIVGEHGEEIMVPAQDGVIIPNHALPAVGKGAFYTKDRTREPLNISGIMQPDGMRDGDFDRFMQGPGAQMVIGSQLESIMMGKRDAAAEKRYERTRKDAMTDRDEERDYNQRMKDLDASALNEGLGLMLQRFGEEGALSPRDLDFFNHSKAKDPKAAAAIGKMLLEFGEEGRRKKAATPKGIEFLNSPDGSGYIPLTVFGDDSKRMAGGYFPNKGGQPAPKAGWVDLGDGDGYYADPQGNVIPTDKILREEEIPGTNGVLKPGVGGTRKVPAYAKPKTQSVRYFDTVSGKVVEFDPEDDVSSITVDEKDADGAVTSRPRFTQLKKASGSSSAAPEAAPAPKAGAAWETWLQSQK